MVTSPTLSQPICRYSLLNGIIPYWRQVAPSTISFEVWVQGSFIDDLLHPSFKPFGFCCQDCRVLQFQECSGCSKCMCFATSEVIELGFRCSLNLDFRDLSVSPMCVASHYSQLILYTAPTTFSLLIGSFGFTNNCRRVFIGLKYVGMPYLPPKKVYLIIKKMFISI